MYVHELESCSIFMYGIKSALYHILENFQGRIISLLLQISLQPQNFNYAKNPCFVIINDN